MRARRLPDLLKDQPAAERDRGWRKLFEDAKRPEDVCQGCRRGLLALEVAIAAVAEVDGGDLIRGLFLTQEAGTAWLLPCEAL